MKNLLNSLIQKFKKNQTLYKEFLNNPKKVVEKELDKTLPSDLNIIVLEDSERVIYLVLPPKTISDDSLDEITGGMEIPEFENEVSFSIKK